MRAWKIESVRVEKRSLKNARVCGLIPILGGKEFINTHLQSRLPDDTLQRANLQISRAARKIYSPTVSCSPVVVTSAMTIELQAHKSPHLFDDIPRRD